MPGESQCDSGGAGINADHAPPDPATSAPTSWTTDDPQATRAANQMANPPSSSEIVTLFNRSWDHASFIRGICSRCRHPYLSSNSSRFMDPDFLIPLKDRKKAYKFLMVVCINASICFIHQRANCRRVPGFSS